MPAKTRNQKSSLSLLVLWGNVISKVSSGCQHAMGNRLKISNLSFQPHQILSAEDNISGNWTVMQEALSANTESSLTLDFFSIFWRKTSVTLGMFKNHSVCQKTWRNSFLSRTQTENFRNAFVSVIQVQTSKDIPGGPVVENLPAKARDMGLIPGQRRSHMPTRATRGTRGN